MRQRYDLDEPPEPLRPGEIAFIVISITLALLFAGGLIMGGTAILRLVGF